MHWLCLWWLSSHWYQVLVYTFRLPSQSALSLPSDFAFPPDLQATSAVLRALELSYPAQLDAAVNQALASCQANGAQLVPPAQMRCKQSAFLLPCTTVGVVFGPI